MTKTTRYSPTHPYITVNSFYRSNLKDLLLIPPWCSTTIENRRKKCKKKTLSNHHHMLVVVLTPLNFFSLFYFKEFFFLLVCEHTNFLLISISVFWVRARLLAVKISCSTQLSHWGNTMHTLFDDDSSFISIVMPPVEKGFIIHPLCLIVNYIAS